MLHELIITSGLFRLPQYLIIALFAVYLLLTIVTAAVSILQRLHPLKDYLELSTRIKSWWIIVLIFTLVILVSQTMTLVFMGFVSFLALKEYLSMIPTRRADRRVLFYAYLAIPIQYTWIHIGWYGMFIIFIPIYMFLLLPARMLIAGQTEGFLKAVGTLHWGIMLTVFGLSHAAYLVVLPSAEPIPADGFSLLFFLLFLTEMNDVAQFVWGKLFGCTKVVPTVSPNKTWEGLLGGVITTLILGVLIAPWLTPLSPVMAALASLGIGVGGFLGDINISAIKRDIGVKDSSSFIPGHGGVLDRVDSLSYTAPLFFHFVRHFY